MDDDYGSNYISISDEDGQEFELEHLDTIEHKGQTYMAFVPADMDEDDEDYGIIILRVIEENGEEVLASVDDDEEKDSVYAAFMEQLEQEEE